MHEPRQRPFNPWPVGLVVALVLFASGLVVLVVVASRGRMELVTRDYYEQELRYQVEMDKQGRTYRLGAGPAVVVDRERGQVVVTLPAEHLGLRPTGRIRLYRPSAAAWDRLVELALDAEGRQVLALSELQPGFWRVRLEWTADGEDYASEHGIRVPGGGGE